MNLQFGQGSKGLNLCTTGVAQRCGAEGWGRLESIEGPFALAYLMVDAGSGRGLRSSPFHLSMWPRLGFFTAWLLLSRARVPRARGPGGRISPFVIMWQSCGITSAAFSWLKQSGTCWGSRKGEGRKVTCWGSDSCRVLQVHCCDHFGKKQLVIGWKYSYQSPGLFGFWLSFSVVLNQLRQLVVIFSRWWMMDARALSYLLTVLIGISAFKWLVL